MTIARNMATLPGLPYSAANPGCVYLVPVQAFITTQAHFFKLHESRHIMLETLIESGDYVKYQALRPELRKGAKKQSATTRKQQGTTTRKQQGTATRKQRVFKQQGRKGTGLGSGWKKPSGVRQSVRRRAPAGLPGPLRQARGRGQRFTPPTPPQPQSCSTLYGAITKWCRGDPKAGVRGISPSKCKRWAAVVTSRIK
jgi:hypothetical protein